MGMATEPLLVRLSFTSKYMVNVNAYHTEGFYFIFYCTISDAVMYIKQMADLFTLDYKRQLFA